MKKLIVDLDGTLTKANTSDYRNVLPRHDVIEKLKNIKMRALKLSYAQQEICVRMKEMLER